MIFLISVVTLNVTGHFLTTCFCRPLLEYYFSKVDGFFFQEWKQLRGGFSTSCYSYSWQGRRNYFSVQEGNFIMEKVVKVITLKW